MKIVADTNIPFLKGALESFAEVLYLPGKDINREILKGVDALLIRTRTKCTEELLKGTSVRFIGTATIGFDHINTSYCEKNGIKWTNAPGCNSSSVQQYIAAAMLKLASDFRFSLKDKTIGIIGVGNVGSKVERFARAIGMNVLLNDPPRARLEGDKNFHSLSSILHQSEIITVHVPYNVVGEDCTYHLLDELSFKKMNKGTFLFNSSRGEVVKTSSLKQALVSGKLGGAVLDVWENEPDIDIDLMARTFIATPHIAGYSADGKANGTSIIVNSLCEHFGLPLKSWYPENVPPPANGEIVIDCKGKSDEEIVREAVYHTYNISVDDINLRFSPPDFEKLRGDYPMRREFSSYRVTVKNGTKRVQKILDTIGFKIAS